MLIIMFIYFLQYKQPFSIDDSTILSYEHFRINSYSRLPSPSGSYSSDVLRTYVSESQIKNVQSFT
jgi:hypothetical protein